MGLYKTWALVIFGTAIGAWLGLLLAILNRKTLLDLVKQDEQFTAAVANGTTGRSELRSGPPAACGTHLRIEAQLRAQLIKRNRPCQTI